MVKINNSKSGKTAFAGICSAVSVVVLYLASVLPTGRLVMCAVASAAVCMMMIKFGYKGALMMYAAVSVISFIILPDKTIFFGYALFFGNYPVVKALIEQKNNIVAEWILKLAAFCIYGLLAYGGMRLFFGQTLVFEYALWIMFAGMLAVASVFDVALSLLISEINRRFDKILK